MIRGILRYLFPRLKPTDRLPLLPRGFSSDHISTAEADQADVRYALGRSAARSQADAHRLLIKSNKKSARLAVNEKRRERRREGRWHKAWRKFRKLME
jgi:hypothetical protein